MRRPAEARAPARAPAPPAEPPSPGAHVVRAGLTLLVALHLAGSLASGTWLWGTHLARFLPAPTSLALAALALAGLGWAWMPGGAAPSARVRELPLPGIALLLAAGVAATCWLLPDRVLFLGDFLYRQGTVAGRVDPGEVLPQAMPLDRWYHVEVPHRMVEHWNVSANFAGRVVGALDALLWGASAAALPWALGLRGSAALAVASLAAFGGSLALFTGYNKPLSDLAVLTLFAGACAARVSRDGRALLPLALATSAAVLLHRSGLALLPLWGTAVVIAVRTPGPWSTARRASVALAALLPLATLAMAFPALLGAIRVQDVQHLAPAEVRAAGFLAATLTPSRLLDLFNVVAWMAPPALLLPALLPLARGRREWALLAALVLPALAVLLFIHPLQGAFRDGDVYAPAGAALAAAAAWLAAGAFRSRGSGRLAAGTVAVCATLALIPLLLFADDARATRRIRAWIIGPPRPPAAMAANALDHLAARAMGDRRWADAADALEAAVEIAPNPRFYMQWGMAETMRENHAEAQRLYRHAVELNPNLTLAWIALGASSSWLGDVPEVRRAVAEIRRLSPAHPKLAELDEFLRRNPGN